MASNALLDDCLDNALGFFNNAFLLSRDCKDALRVINKQNLRDETRISKCAGDFRRLCATVSRIAEEMEKYSGELEDIDTSFRSLASVLRNIREGCKQDEDALLKAWPELDSSATRGKEAIARYREPNRIDDFAFLDKEDPQVLPGDKSSDTLAADPGNTPVIVQEEPGLPAEQASDDGTGEKPKPVPEDEANLAARKFISEKEESGENVTAAMLHKHCGIAQGRVPDLLAWRAYQIRKKIKKALNSKGPRTRRLTQKILEAIGLPNDISQKHLSDEEAVLTYLKDKGTPEEYSEFLKKDPAKQEEAIELCLQQWSESAAQHESR